MSFPFACNPIAMCHYMPRFFLSLSSSALFFLCFQVDLEPFSVYHLTTKEIFVAMGTLMEGFFDGDDVVIEVMAFAFTAAQGAPAKTPILSDESGPIKEGAQIEGVSESTSIPIKTLTPQKGLTPATTSQTESASHVTSPVISASDPFAALSQAVKDVSSLVVTHASIPSSATRGPDVDLSFDEESEEVLEDFEDEPTIKKRSLFPTRRIVASIRLRPWICISCPC